MMRTIRLVLAGALLASGSAHPATADAWSSAAAIERAAIRIHPWDPESFRHPELYGEDGHKLTDHKPHGQSPRP